MFIVLIFNFCQIGNIVEIYFYLQSTCTFPRHFSSLGSIDQCRYHRQSRTLFLLLPWCLPSTLQHSRIRPSSIGFRVLPLLRISSLLIQTKIEKSLIKGTVSVIQVTLHEKLTMPDLEHYTFTELSLIQYKLYINVFVFLNCLFSFAASLQK